MTTNYMNRLDKALIRPDRIDYCVFILIMPLRSANKAYVYEILSRKDDECEELLAYIKKNKLKLTTAILQQFLFTYMNEPNIMGNILG